MPLGDWLYDQDANKFNNSYFRDANNTGFAVDMSGDLIVRGSMEIEKPIDSVAYGAGTQIMNFKTYYSPAYDKGTIKSAIISGVSDKTTLRTDNGYLAFATADTGTLHERMRIEKNGNVGIGTTSPIVPLQINTYTQGTSTASKYSYVYGDQEGFYNGSLNRSGRVTLWSNVSGGDIISHGFIAGYSLNFSSDRRIKKDIVEINDSVALDKLRLLKPSTYKYIDYRSRTDKVVYGFIAQEVKDVLPYAVTVGSNPIGNNPNQYCMCDVSGTTLTFSSNNNSYINDEGEYVSDNSGNTNLFEIDASGEFLPVVFYNKNGSTIERKISNIINETSFVIDIPLDDDDVENETIFCLGQKVNDFHTLDKNVIFTVATAALQEVDRQLQAEKAKTATLESQLADVLTRLTALENA